MIKKNVSSVLNNAPETGNANELVKAWLPYNFVCLYLTWQSGNDTVFREYLVVEDL